MRISPQPAAYLQRAAQHYAQLVPTHPMEVEEWADALAACRQLTSDLIYQGQWPAQAIPEAANSKPEEPEANGGLTKSEQLVSQDLVQFWNSLPQAGHAAALATAVHTCQSTLQSRILRRLYPDYWVSTPGSLQRDAQVERERWKSPRS